MATVRHTHHNNSLDRHCFGRIVFGQELGKAGSHVDFYQAHIVCKLAILDCVFVARILCTSTMKRPQVDIRKFMLKRAKTQDSGDGKPFLYMFSEKPILIGGSEINILIAYTPDSCLSSRI